MSVVNSKDPQLVVGRAAAKAFVDEAKSSPIAKLREEYAQFLGTLSGGARGEFNAFIQQEAPELAAQLKLGNGAAGASPGLKKAIESAFDAQGGALKFTAQDGRAPFYGAHLAPVDVELGGEKFKLFVSAEEGKFGAPTRPEDSNTAVLQRVSDGKMSTDLRFSVPERDKPAVARGPVADVPPDFYNKP